MIEKASVMVSPLHMLLALLLAAASVLGVHPQSLTEGSSGAGHWALLDSQTASYVYDLACPDVRTCYATAAQGTIIGTSDGGSVWTSLLTGADPGPWGLACPSPTTCVAGTGHDFHILRTVDSGRTWDLVYQPAATSPDSIDGDVGNYYFPGLYGGTCISISTCFLVGTVGHVFRTTDGGTTWTVAAGEYSSVPQAVGITRQSVLNGVSCPTVSVCYAAGLVCNCEPPAPALIAGEIAISVDGGATWRGRTVANLVDDVTCINALTCVAVGLQGTILRTTDGGRSWPAVPNVLRGGRTNLYAVHCVGLTCRAVGGNTRGTGAAVLVSTDGGLTWRQEALPTSASLDAIACPRADLCYLGGAGGTVLKGS